MKRLNSIKAIVACLAVAFFAVGNASVTQAATPAASNYSLPETSALERDLSSSRKTVESTRQRQQRLQSKARSVRKQLQSIQSMIASIRSVESKMQRIERELNSLSKIPQLKMLKPVAKGLKSLRGKVATVRSKAESFRQRMVDPNIRRIQKFESQVARTVSKLRGMEAQLQQGQQQINQLRTFVEARLNQRNVVNALEQISRTTRREIQPMRQAITDIDRAGAGVESKLNSFSSSADQLLSLKSGIDKINRKISPIDKKAKDLAKVMDKKLGFKVPFTKKRVSFTVRKILEAPNKILKPAVKPLTKLANKLLSPLTKKVNFDVKAPKELAQIQAQIDRLSRIDLGLDAAAEQLRRSTDSNNLRKAEASLKQLLAKRTSHLG